MINFKELETEEGRREYYDYNPGDPSSLCHHQEPYLDPRFNERLAQVFGRDPHGDQRIRIAWAGSLRAPSYKIDGDNVIEYDGMKYPYMRLVNVVGYEYFDLRGRKVFVKTLDMVPADAVYTKVVEYDDLGIMKFVIEMKFTAEEMVQLGKYPKPGSPEEDTWCVKNGKRYRSKPNPSGEYVFCHYVETEDGRFADVTEDIIDRIVYIYNRAQSETEQEYIDRKLEERERLAMKEKIIKELNFRDHIENARIAAEKRLAKGEVLYSK